MADYRGEQFEAYKAAARRFESEMKKVPTGEEAITLAIKAAENLMKAIQLATDASEKKKIKKHCKDLMDLADQIKSQSLPLLSQPTPVLSQPLPVLSQPPPVLSQPPPILSQPPPILSPTTTLKNQLIGQWASAVENDIRADTPGEPGASECVVESASDLYETRSSGVATSAPFFHEENRPRDVYGNNITHAVMPMLQRLDISAQQNDDLIDLGSSERNNSNLIDLGFSERNNSNLIDLGSSERNNSNLIDLDSPPRSSAQQRAQQNYSSRVPESRVESDTTHASRLEFGPQPIATNGFGEPDGPPAAVPLQENVNTGKYGPMAPPAFVSAAQVQRLKPSISTRKRSTREDILLLKASKLNGFKFPPWDKDPRASEFELVDEVFKDDKDLSLSTYQQQFFDGWIRAQTALPPPPGLADARNRLGPVMHSTEPIDLVQDAATDCSVVASLCAGTARAERGYEKLLSNKVWPYDKHLGRPIISQNGKYIVRLNFNGCWRKVTVDDRLPVANNHRVLHVIDRRNPALLWPILLEKAYLKVRGGYDFPGSNSCSDLWTLTGWIPEEIYLQATETVPSELWRRIYNAFQTGDILVTLGTGKMTTAQERELRLEGQHSYVVLDMKETDEKDRLLLIKNPWVEGKGWGSNLTVPVLDTPSSETTCWVGLDQVIQHYERLYLNWNPGLFLYRQDIHFDWTITSTNVDPAYIAKHPQFSFTSKGGLVWLLLSRHFRDGPDVEGSDAFNDGTVQPDTQAYSSNGESALKGYTSIYVCDGNGQQVYMGKTYLERSPYVNTHQCLLTWDAVPKQTYTVVIDQQELPASTYTFSLSAFSNSALSLEHATSIYPFQRIDEGAWTKDTAGGDTRTTKYFSNPQYTLRIKEQSSLAILLMGNEDKDKDTLSESGHLNVKLVFGHGKRMYRLQSRDVLADSGDYGKGCVFAEAKDLQPGLYTIICSLFEPGKTGSYTLQVDSTCQLEMSMIPRDGAGLISTPVAGACFGPDVRKLALPLHPKRLAEYTIISRFLKATTPRSGYDISTLARSPLRLSLERGRGPDRKFLITSEGGQYSDTSTVRTESFDLDPVLGTNSSIWLVLDRLSGPGGPVEEYYKVEILTDVPDAFVMGVWRAVE